jgi:sugar transferase (PEP-CTERM/EpsH1 system associated)
VTVGDRVVPPLIVHVIFRLDYGGLENGLVNLLNRLPAHKFRHAIVCLAGYSDFRHRIQRPDVEIYSLDKKPGKDLGVYVRFWRLLRRLKPAVVHTRNLGTIDMQFVALAAGVRVRVHGEHGWDASDPLGLNPRTLLIRRVCRRAIQRYIAMSRDLAQWLEATVGVAPARITQLYNGVDVQKFSLDGSVPDDLPWKREEHFVFGTVGRIDPIKNQQSLIEAFAALVAERPQDRNRLRLIIVGGGPLLEKLQARATELGIGDLVWFPGPRNDIPGLIRAMDVFVLPSLNEGISNTVLEAMSSARPVIAGRVGGNPELIEAGQTGALYDSKEEGALLRCMRAYVELPELAVKHGVAARERAERCFGIDAMVRNYAAFYEQALA